MFHPFFASRRRRALTFIETMVVVGILGLISVPIFATLMWVTRAWATTQDMSLTRINTDLIINQLEQDIRNSTVTAYNSPQWPRLSGTASTAPVMSVTLLDMVHGQRILWTYTRATGRLSRRVTFLSGGAEAVRQTDYTRIFPDFQLAEVLRNEVGWPAPRATGIRITGRVFHSLEPNNTIWNEIDGNGDDTYRNDIVGRDMFGLTFQGDDPKWQHIFNVQVAFRNT